MRRHKRHSSNGAKYPQRHRFAKAVDTCIVAAAQARKGTRMKSLGHCVRTKMRTKKV